LLRDKKTYFLDLKT